MKKKTTIYDIAQELNVTVSTVSRALSGFPAISAATRSAVFEAAKRLNYSPNKLASALKSGKTYTIGVIVPSVEAHFFASIIHSIEETLKINGYRIILYQSKELLENEINGVKTLMEAQVDGIMASMSLQTDDVAHFQEVIDAQKPLILFDRINQTLQAPTVTLNDYSAGYLAAEHLINRGYKNIALLTTKNQIRIFAERLRGFKDALLNNHLVLNQDCVVFEGLSIEDGMHQTEKLLKNNPEVDAIVAADDFTALGAIKKLRELKKLPPEIAVIGFANEAFAEHITPDLSTINQFPAQIGEACAEMFMNMITSEKPYEQIRHIVIEPQVIARGSTNGKPG